MIIQIFDVASQTSATPDTVTQRRQWIQKVNSEWYLCKDINSNMWQFCCATVLYLITSFQCYVLNVYFFIKCVTGYIVTDKITQKETSSPWVIQLYFVCVIELFFYKKFMLFIVSWCKKILVVRIYFEWDFFYQESFHTTTIQFKGTVAWYILVSGLLRKSSPWFLC